MKTKLLLLSFLVPIMALGQITQIGADIDGEAEYNFSGNISLSSNGSIVAIGAQGNNVSGNLSGHVRVFQNMDGVWTQIGADIDGQAEWENSGASVSLSSDGNTVALGAPGNSENGETVGQVRVYQYDGDNWIQFGADINGENEMDWSGSSVSLSDSGEIVAIGAPGNSDNGQDSGQVRVYQNVDGDWVQLGADINGEAAGDQSGRSVSLSDDGSVLAVGAVGNDGGGIDSGHVRVYYNAGGTWTQIGSDIDGEAAGDNSGDSVDLNGNGTIVAIGAPLNTGSGSMSGHVRVYRNVDGYWVQIGEDINGEAAGDYLGGSVSLNSDGSVLAIGADMNDGNGLDSGHVRIYRNAGDSWVYRGPDIDGEAEYDYSGGSIDLSDDGAILAIGALGNDGNGIDSGHVRVFDISGVLDMSDPSELRFSIYPNPTTGILNISAKTPIQQIEIYNAFGQLVMATSNQNTIDISGVRQGIYFARVFDEEGTTGIHKIIKR